MTAPDPTPTPECEHNWPGITALTIPFTTCAVITALICGGYPPHTPWQAACWLLLAATLVLAVALTASARRQDHWRTLAHQHAATIRDRDAETEDLRRTIRGDVGDDAVRAAGHVLLDPAERTAFINIQAPEDVQP